MESRWMEKMKDASRSCWRFTRPLLEREVAPGALFGNSKDLTGGIIFRK